MSLICGIDPGQKGAIVLLGNKGKLLYLDDLDDTDKTYFNIMHIIEGIKVGNPEIHVYLENVHALPLQSTVSGFKFGKNIGKAEMLAYSIQKEYKRVTPQKWKKYFELSRVKKDSVLLARKLWPEYEKEFLISKDGRAEAALIANYGRLQEVIDED